jgi:hypothetical protein
MVFQENIQRLKVYKNKLVVFPRKSKAKKGDTARTQLTSVVQNTSKDIIPLPKPTLRIKVRTYGFIHINHWRCIYVMVMLMHAVLCRLQARAIKPEEKKFLAYATLRKALRDAKNVSP